MALPYSLTKSGDSYKVLVKLPIGTVKKEGTVWVARDPFGNVVLSHKTRNVAVDALLDPTVPDLS